MNIYHPTFFSRISKIISHIIIPLHCLFNWCYLQKSCGSLPSPKVTLPFLTTLNFLKCVTLKKYSSQILIFDTNFLENSSLKYI